jgi:hypothetical protein
MPGLGSMPISMGGMGQGLERHLDQAQRSSLRTGLSGRRKLLNIAFIILLMHLNAKRAETATGQPVSGNQQQGSWTSPACPLSALFTYTSRRSTQLGSFVFVLTLLGSLFRKSATCAGRTVSGNSSSSAVPWIQTAGPYQILQPCPGQAGSQTYQVIGFNDNSNLLVNDCQLSEVQQLEPCNPMQQQQQQLRPHTGLFGLERPSALVMHSVYPLTAQRREQLRTKNTAAHRDLISLVVHGPPAMHVAPLSYVPNRRHAAGHQMNCNASRHAVSCLQQGGRSLRHNNGCGSTGSSSQAGGASSSQAELELWTAWDQELHDTHTHTCYTCSKAIPAAENDSSRKRYVICNMDCCACSGFEGGAQATSCMGCHVV